MGIYVSLLNNTLLSNVGWIIHSRGIITMLLKLPYNSELIALRFYRFMTEGMPLSRETGALLGNCT